MEESDPEALQDKKAAGTQGQEVFPFLLQLGKVSDFPGVSS